MGDCVDEKCQLSWPISNLIDRFVNKMIVLIANVDGVTFFKFTKHL